MAVIFLICHDISRCFFSDQWFGYRMEVIMDYWTQFFIRFGMNLRSGMPGHREWNLYVLSSRKVVGKSARSFHRDVSPDSRALKIALSMAICCKVRNFLDKRSKFGVFKVFRQSNWDLMDQKENTWLEMWCMDIWIFMGELTKQKWRNDDIKGILEPSTYPCKWIKVTR